MFSSRFGPQRAIQKPEFRNILMIDALARPVDALALVAPYIGTGLTVRFITALFSLY